MKQLSSLIVISSFLFFVLAGCNSPTPSPLTKEGFPKVMVGIWQAEMKLGSKWAFKFEPDGSITKLIHFLAGPIEVASGGVHKENSDGTYYLFLMDKCQTEYDAKSKNINVKVFVSHFEMKAPTGTIKGRIEDYLSGPVSEDGKTWHVNWVNLGWVEDATPPPVDLLFKNPKPLIFKKLEIDFPDE